MKIKKLDLLISIYIAAICMAELMGGKIFQVTDQIQLFGKPIGTSVAVFLLPLVASINDIVVETHGKKRMQSIMRSGFVVIAMIFIFTLVATLLPTATRSPIPGDVYNQVFQVAQRVAVASLTAFTISMALDVLIFARVREKLKRFGLWFRNISSNVVSQFFDTSIFMYIAYYNFTNPNHDFLWSLIIPYWIYKCIVSVLIIPVVYLGVSWLKNEKDA